MANTELNKNLAERRSDVDEAINSVSLEGFELSKAQRDNFEKYATGQITLEQMEQFTTQKYVG